MNELAGTGEGKTGYNCEPVAIAASFNLGDRGGPDQLDVPRSVSRSLFSRVTSWEEQRFFSSRGSTYLSRVHAVMVLYGRDEE